MKKILISVILALLILPTIFALDLEIEKKSADAVFIKDLTDSVTFKLEITNKGMDDKIQFYNLVGFLVSPSELISLKRGETKQIDLIATPAGKLPFENTYYLLKVFIKGQRESSELQQELPFKIVTLDEAFKIKTIEINPNSESVIVPIENLVNFDFKEVKLQFKSSFFNQEKTFSFEPYEKKEIVIKLNPEEFKSLLAGYYSLETLISVEDVQKTAQSTILFSEEDLLEKQENSSGFIIRTTKISKKNTGNVVLSSPTTVKKDIISRLFTSFNSVPSLSERQGLFVYYTWNEEILPGQERLIVVRTNWILPFLFILLVLVVVVLAKQYSIQNLMLKKKIAFVRTKGGEFALKISIIAEAKRTVERITITDKLPSFVRLYENYGVETPKRVDEKNKKLEWSFEEIPAGHSKTVSYIVYSKIGFLGKFALPTAKAVYERAGKIHETESNKSYFFMEQRKEENK
ncbi:MAG TPA: hypothetical protein PLK34_02795 [Candidatus Pacearchaeota archaeon]|nr:hypothetical protein [Candidatus Pacearchaeota archaeon]